MGVNERLETDEELRETVESVAETYGLDEEEMDRLYDNFSKKDHNPTVGRVEMIADCMYASDPRP